MSLTKYTVITFQHTLKYSRLSISPASGSDYFYLNLDSGMITVARPLTGTNVNTFQITISVTDNGYPPRSSITPAIVTVQVLRNQFDPFFLNTPYSVTIPETTSISSSIIQVTARDQDTVSVAQNSAQITIYHVQINAFDNYA